MYGNRLTIFCPTIFSRAAAFSCFADLALTSPEDYKLEGQGSLMQCVLTPADRFMPLTNEQITAEVDQQARTQLTHRFSCLLCCLIVILRQWLSTITYTAHLPLLMPPVQPVCVCANGHYPVFILLCCACWIAQAQYVWLEILVITSRHWQNAPLKQMKVMPATQPP